MNRTKPIKNGSKKGHKILYDIINAPVEEYEFTDEVKDSDNSDFIENNKDNIENNQFLYSLENLTPDDIAPPEPKKKITASDLIYITARYVLLAVSVTVFAWSIYTIANNLIAYKRAEDLYNNLANDLVNNGSETAIRDDEKVSKFAFSPMLEISGSTPDFASSLVGANSSLIDEVSNVEITKYNEHFIKMKNKLNALINKNPDTYGWITVGGTDINYPVVQGEDNDFYLNHAYNGDSLPAGSIFVDYRCYDNIMKNFNTILYGHNMKNGMMFNALVNYTDETFFKENPYIEIATMEGIYTYEVFAIYETRSDYKYIQTAFPDYRAFIEFANEMKANSMYEREGIEFKEGDRMLTLSTCTNGVRTGRYSIQAKLVNVEK